MSRCACRIPALLVAAWWVACGAGLSALAQGDAAPSLPTLRIATDPPGALVAVDRVARGNAPVEVGGLAPGKHLVTLTQRGYRDAFETVMLDGSQSRTLEVRLEPIHGSALVRSEPTGANVAVDGAHRGTTPLLLTHLELGKHRVAVTRPGFQDRVLDLEVFNASPQQLDVTLLTDSATLRVNSDPPGVEVLLNGVPRGQTPVVLERIPDGDSVVELKSEGYAPYRQSIRLSAGDDESVDVALVPLPASLQVVSMPPGARVYIDNQYRGDSPLALENLTPGTVRVRVELPAHDPMARDVALARAASVVEEFRLVPNCGSLRVVTSPAGVTVLVDGKNVGETVAKPEATDQVSEPLQVPLVPVGARELVFVRQGFYEQKRTVTVERDQMATVDVTLRRRFIPDYEVRTESNVYRGVLVNITPEFIRLETEIGVIRAFPVKDVKSRRPLREDERMVPEPRPEE